MNAETERKDIKTFKAKRQAEHEHTTMKIGQKNIHAGPIKPNSGEIWLHIYWGKVVLGKRIGKFAFEAFGGKTIVSDSRLTKRLA